MSTSPLLGCFLFLTQFQGITWLPLPSQSLQHLTPVRGDGPQIYSVPEFLLSLHHVLSLILMDPGSVVQLHSISRRQATRSHWILLKVSIQCVHVYRVLCSRLSSESPCVIVILTRKCPISLFVLSTISKVLTTLLCRPRRKVSLRFLLVIIGNSWPSVSPCLRVLALE